MGCRCNHYSMEKQANACVNFCVYEIVSVAKWFKCNCGRQQHGSLDWLCKPQGSCYDI